jgi:hypothetical protein
MRATASAPDWVVAGVVVGAVVGTEVSDGRTVGPRTASATETRGALARFDGAAATEAPSAPAGAAAFAG